VSRCRGESSPTQREEDEEEQGGAEERLLRLQRDCSMTSILQEALYKRDQVAALLAER